MGQKTAKTIQEIRHQQNIRAKRWQQAQRDQGKRHLTAMISGDVHLLIARQREQTGQNTAQVIEQAVTMAYGGGAKSVIDPTALGGPLPGVDQIQVDKVTPADDTTIDYEQSIDTDTTPADDIDQLDDDGQDGDDNPVDTDIDDGLPNYQVQDLSQDERDRILIQVVTDYPSRADAQKRAEVLNKMGLICGKGKTPWDAKKVGDNYRQAVKRQENISKS